MSIDTQVLGITGLILLALLVVWFIKRPNLLEEETDSEWMNRQW